MAGNLTGQEFRIKYDELDSFCDVPLDTFYRYIYIDPEDPFNDYDSFQVDSLEIRFNNFIGKTVEYFFGGFTTIKYNTFNYEYDTLGYSFTSNNPKDSVILFSVFIDSAIISGIRYIDYPDTTESKLSIYLSNSDSIEYSNFRFLFHSDTVGDWREFQPLAVGNIWRYGGPYTLTAETRYSVFDEDIRADTSFFFISRQEKVYSGYDGLSYTVLPTDTIIAYTMQNDPYLIRSDGYQFLLYENFRPYDQSGWDYGFEQGIRICVDGSTEYYTRNMGGTEVWRYGVGSIAAYADGGGGWKLQGYRVGDSEWGDYSIIVSADESDLIIPDNYYLYNYPNPFNPSTTIRYEIPEQSVITLSIYDIQGRNIQTLVSESKPAGHYEAQWNGIDESGKQVAAGMYFARLQVGDYASTIKMVNLR